jgi:uncharacterized protein YdgA (DUF945 family)
MKKVISLVIGILVALVVIDMGAAYYVGIKAKHKFVELVTFLNNKGSFATYEITSYHKGILKSEVITHVKFKYNNDPKKFIIVKHTILHGPIIIGGSSRKPIDFQLAVINSQPMEMAADYKVPFSTQTIFKFNGDTLTNSNGTIDIRDPAFQIQSSGWNTHTQISHHWTKVKGDFRVPEVTIQIMGLPIVIKDIQFIFDQYRSPAGDWLGDLSFSVGNALQKEQNIELNDLKVFENATLENQLIHANWGADFNRLLVATALYGPLHLQVQIVNIDPEAFKVMANQSGSSTDNNQQSESLRKLLSKRPKITIKPSQITLPQGDFKIDAELAIGSPDITAPIDNDKIASTADGYLHAIVPKEILRQGLLTGITREMTKDPEYQKLSAENKKKSLDQQLELKIQKLIKIGLMVEKEKEYEIKVSIEKGKWMVNGKEIQKSEMVSRATRSSTKSFLNSTNSFSERQISA